MNKQEFKSAYNKITLSEEFKTEARAKLTEQFGKTVERYPSDNIIEEHPAAAITLSPNNERKKSPWKTVIGIGSAAAVIGLGIWGGSVWLDRTQNPLDGQSTTEVTESVESNESTETTEVIDTATAELVEHRVTFPAYYDGLDENNKLISDIVPFDLDISLPEGWEIVTPEWSEHIGYSMVNIMADGECVGTIDINKYEKYEGMEYGSPNYHQMVFNQLFLGSVVNWSSDYTEVKTDGWMKSATCSVYHNPANGYADDVEYTSGILAYDDDMQVYVNIYFNRVLDEKLHTEIAESISITESTMGLADRLAALMIEQESGLRYNVETDLRIYAVDTACGTYVSVAYPTDDGTALSLYEIRDSRIIGSMEAVASLMYVHTDTAIFRDFYTLPNGRQVTSYILYTPEDKTFETIAEFEFSKSDDGWETYDIIMRKGNEETPLTLDEMNERVSEIVGDFTSIVTFPSSARQLTQHTECNVKDLATIIRQTLYVMERIPEEEPAPMPPNLFLDAEGAERPLLMGSYTWGEGLDEFHHDGYTIEDVISTGIGYVYPASWFEDARLVIPDGGVITSVTLHRDEQNYTALEFTADGAIILPADPVGEHIWVTVEYPEGACSYLMSVDFPETAEPPAVTLDGKELTIGSYIWNGELSGDHPRNKDVYQMFLDGELLTVTDAYTVYLELPEGARLIEALCFGEDMESEMTLGCEESGEVRLPAAYVKSEGVVRLGVEYPDGSVSYWMGFRHAAEEYSVPEMLTAASAQSVEFELWQSPNAWEDKGLYHITETKYIDIFLPDGAKITNAHAVCKEGIEYDLRYAEKGRVWMPFYDSMIINVTVSFSQGEGEYCFIHKGTGAPELIVYSEESGVEFSAFCSRWGWADTMFEATEEDYGYEQALEMHNSGGWFFNLYDEEELLLNLPVYSTDVKMEYYDENGIPHEVIPTEHGTYPTADMTDTAIIKVTLECFEGTCEYWFSHYRSVSGTEEPELEELENPPYVELTAADKTIIPCMGSYYWCYEDNELNADAMWIIDAEKEGIVPHIDASTSGSITVQIPNGGTLQSAVIENESGLQQLEITPDGVITLPDDPIGYLVRIKVNYYTQGNCEYYFALDNYYNGE